MLAFINSTEGVIVSSTGGVQSYWNIKASLNNSELQSIFEVPLFTDSCVVGDINESTSCYSILNLCNMHAREGFVYESLILRARWFLKNERRFDLETDESAYHSGWAADEIAAIVGMILGIRLKAGDIVREYGGFNADPLGRPKSSRRPNSIFEKRHGTLIVPSLCKTVNIGSVLDFKLLANLDKGDYIALIRAARMYQDAIWIVESEPELAWLILVSALETAANHWDKTNYSVLQKLEKSKPKLYERLHSVGGEDLCMYVAKEIEGTLGATNKFIKFCIEFFPEAPIERPAQYAQVKWSKSNFRIILNVIYSSRSKALHGGIPFAAPFCLPPTIIELNAPASEKGMLGLAQHSHGASWKSQDIPISANCFFMFAHGVLNKWLRYLLREKS